MQIQTHLQLGKPRPRELSTSGGEGPVRPTQPPPGAAHPLGPHGTGRASLGQINWKGPCGYHRAQRLLHLSALGWWLRPPSLLWSPLPRTPCCHCTGAGLGPPAWCDFISKTRTQQASRPNKAAPLMAPTEPWRLKLTEMCRGCGGGLSCRETPRCPPRSSMLWRRSTCLYYKFWVLRVG